MPGVRPYRGAQCGGGSALGVIPGAENTDSRPPHHGRPHVMAVLGLDPRINPAIGYPHQFANDAIPVSNHPMEMAGSSPIGANIRHQQHISPSWPGEVPTRFTHLKIARLFSWLQAYVFEVVSCRLPRPILPMARSWTRIRLCGRPAATFASGCGTRCVHLVGSSPAMTR